MRPFLTGLVIAATLLLADLAHAATPVSDGSLTERLARYALDTGQPDRALHWIWGDTSAAAGMLRGEAYAALGASAQAKDQLEAVRGQGRPLTPQAELVLARANQSLGDVDAAAILLRQLRRSGSGSASQEAAYLQAEQSIEEQAYDQAGQILASAPDGYWTAMGYLNLATAYARQDEDTARSLIALRVARAMLGDRAGETHPELLQRIQLTAGYLALKSNDPDKAISFLDKVSLNGYHTPQALYLHGLALARKENFRAAMQSWHRARKFPLGFPGAADAWLGMGRAFDESGYLGQAGEAYLGAIAAFEGELVTLNKLKQQVVQQGAFDAVVRTAGSDNVEWFLADSKTLTQPRLAYLMHFMEKPDAQQSVRAVADLERLETALSKRRADLEVFEDMLSRRLARISNRNGLSRLDAIGERIQALKARRQSLQSQLDTAAETGKVAAMASGEVAEKLKQVQALRAQKKLTPAEQERLERLEGVLTWKAQEQFDLARREHERQLAGIDRSLEAAARSFGRFDQQLNETPARFADLIARVKAARHKTDALVGRIGNLRQRAESQLDEKLMAFLDAQYQVMSAHLDRSEQQIAHLYEYLAMNRETAAVSGGEQ